jgi:hypothetical protein
MDMGTKKRLSIGGSSILGHIKPLNAVKNPSNAAITGENLSPVAVSAKRAYQLLGIGEKLGRRLIRDGIIPSVRLGRRILVPVEELRKMLRDRCRAERSCRTCAKKDKKGKCAVFSAPPKNIDECPAWTINEDWNFKVWRDVAKYEERKG